MNPLDIPGAGLSYSSDELAGRRKRQTRNGSRPRLTTIGERLVSCLRTGRPPATSPLPVVPRRLLVVKVFGMGDSVLVRSIIEHLLKRNPQLTIDVMIGPATRELITLGRSFRVHEYRPHELHLRGAIHQLFELRSCHYDAILNFEQRSLAGSAFLAMAGARSHIGFLSIGDDSKSAFLTHAHRFDDNQSMWLSFIKLAQLVDPNIPAEAMPIPPPCDDKKNGREPGWPSEV